MTGTVAVVLQTPDGQTATVTIPVTLTPHPGTYPGPKTYPGPGTFPTKKGT